MFSGTPDAVIQRLLTEIGKPLADTASRKTALVWNE